MDSESKKYTDINMGSCALKRKYKNYFLRGC